MPKDADAAPDAAQTCSRTPADADDPRVDWQRPAFAFGPLAHLNPNGMKTTRPNRRLLGLLRKESLQILRDPSSLAIAFVLPAVLLLLFGYGVSLDSKQVPIGFVIMQPGAEAASFLGAFQHSVYFQPLRLPHPSGRAGGPACP